MTDYRHTLKNVEIAKAGTWDRRVITPNDFEQIVANFSPVPTRPGDHMGWECGKVTALRLSGDVLLADLEVDDETVAAIKFGLIDSCSVWIYRTKHGAHLDHVGLMDCRRPPAVKGLAELHTFLPSEYRNRRDHGRRLAEAAVLPTGGD